MKPYPRLNLFTILAILLPATVGAELFYEQNFDAFADGAVDLQDGSIIASNDSTNAVQGGVLRLTEAGTNSTASSFVLPPFDASNGWSATFDFSIEHSGANTPADGFSFNYGEIPAGENFGSPAEEGYGDAVQHLSFQVDTWLWDNPDQDAGVGIKVSGSEVAFNKAVGEDANFKPEERVSASAIISWDPANEVVSFQTTGLRVNADFTNVPLDGFAGDPAYGFSLLARTGGHNETLEIDNLRISGVFDPSNGGDPDNGGGGDPDNGGGGDPDNGGGGVVNGGSPVITEFMADNNTALEDDQGAFSDWIEIHNPDAKEVVLGGWSLTDDPDDLQKWTFPSRAKLAPGAYMVVHASGLNLAGLFDNTYHTNFSLSSGGEYLALVDPDGNVVQNFEESYPNQYLDVSYGSDGELDGYFSRVTPGNANSGFTEPPVKKVDFSVDGKTFFDSSELELTHEDPEVEIRYTLDGSEPTVSLFKPAILYTGPITIESTTTVRARAFKDGALPGRVKSEVFIQLGDDMKDFDTSLGLAFIDSDGINVDTKGKDRLYGASAVFVKQDKVTGLAKADGESDWSGRIGMRRRGQSSLNFAKKQYHMESWDENDRDKAVSIFGMPSESDWVIQAPYADKTLMRNYLVYGWSRAMGHYAVRTKFIEVFYNPDDDEPVTYDDYRGVYVFMERIKRDGDRVDLEPLLPEHDSEPEITGGYIFRKDKENQNNTTFRTGTERQTLQLIEPEYTITDGQLDWLTNYMSEMEEALHGENRGDPETGFRKYWNVANAIDNHILVEFAKNIDGYRISNYIYKDRGGKLNYVAWDYNLSLGNADYLDGWKPKGWYYEDINTDQYPWYPDMFKDPEFVIEYADRWYQLRRGMLSEENVLGKIDETTDFIREAADRNFVRWNRLGVYDWPNPPGFVNRKTYQQEVNFMRDWVTERLEWFDDQFELPVKLSQQGGQVEPGTVLTMDNKISLFKQRPGKMYYTFDGSDPRLRGGEPNPEATLYDGGVTLTDSGTLKARLLLNTGSWSAINEATFIVGQSASADTLLITEIMYNPGQVTPEEVAAGYMNSDFEYIELLNTSDVSVQLIGAQLIDGINFDFNDSAMPALGAGQRAVLVSNEAAFTMRYGNSASVVGSFSAGKLSNGGETLKLLAADGESVIAEFAYDDDADGGWPADADGTGRSLVLVDETVGIDFSLPTAWVASSSENGSPGVGEGDGGGGGGGNEPGPSEGDFAILEVSYTAADGIDLTFTSEPGQGYQVQVSDDLRTFTLLQSVTGANGATTTRFQGSLDANAQYVRVAKQ